MATDIQIHKASIFFKDTKSTSPSKGKAKRENEVQSWIFALKEQDMENRKDAEFRMKEIRLSYYN